MVFRKTPVSAAPAVSASPAPFATLSRLDTGSCRVAGLSGADSRRLCELGFVPGAEVRVLKRTAPDSVIVSVGNCRLALARGMDRCVQVR